MIITTATMPCSDARPRMPEGASPEYGIRHDQAAVGNTVQGTSLPSSAFGAGGRVMGVDQIAPTFETKQALFVGARAWSPPV